MLVGSGGLTLFPGTPLLEEAKRGEYDPLSEKEMLEELKLFAENLECDCSFITTSIGDDWKTVTFLSPVKHTYLRIRTKEAGSSFLLIGTSPRSMSYQVIVNPDVLPIMATM